MRAASRGFIEPSQFASPKRIEGVLVGGTGVSVGWGVEVGTSGEHAPDELTVRDAPLSPVGDGFTFDAH